MVVTAFTAGMGRDYGNGGGNTQLELVDERQVSPLVLSAVFLFLMIAGSYGLVHWMYSTQAAINQFYWYMERAAGFTAYELLAFAAILGISNTSGAWDRWRARYTMTQLHQFVTLLLFAFVGLHLWGLHEDTTIPFPWQRIAIPFMSTYRPLTTACGALGLYGLVVLFITSWLRRVIGVKVWRAIHFLSFPVFLLVTLHGIFTGTDSPHTWAMVLYGVPLAIFSALLWRRLRKPLKQNF